MVNKNLTVKVLLVNGIVVSIIGAVAVIAMGLATIEPKELEIVQAEDDYRTCDYYDDCNETLAKERLEEIRAESDRLQRYWFGFFWRSSFVVLSGVVSIALGAILEERWERRWKND